MKKIVAIAFITGLLLSCNSKNDQEKNSTTAVPVEKQQQPAEKETGLVLNNGAKWKADSTTLLNVALLQKIAAGARKENLENYMQTATQLEEGISKMINECKMKGPDHEALHHWLEPLIERTKELKKATTVAEATTIFSEIERRINLFSEFFE
jgi:hypothetical protein